MTVDTGAFVISLDFELLWGARDRRTAAQYGAHILGVRHVVPRLLDLFESHAIGCTWATVGFLFFDDRDEPLAHLPDLRPDYRDPRSSPYPEIETIGPDERSDPYYFGPPLLRQVMAAPRQEVATHTFSRYYCLESGQTIEAFRADREAARCAAARLGSDLALLLRQIRCRMEATGDPREALASGCLRPAVRRGRGPPIWICEKRSSASLRRCAAPRPSAVERP